MLELADEDNCEMKSTCKNNLRAVAMVLLLCTEIAAQQSRVMPPQKRQPNPEKVVQEHMAAFSACDWNRLLAGFAENAVFFAPNGSVVQGRKALGEMYATVVKPPSQGGTCGLKVTAEHTFVVGDTINVQWRADAPFLAEPYRGADAYETHAGLMAAQVTTFDQSALKFKKSSH